MLAHVADAEWRMYGGPHYVARAQNGGAAAAAAAPAEDDGEEVMCSECGAVAFPGAACA